MHPATTRLAEKGFATTGPSLNDAKKLRIFNLLWHLFGAQACSKPDIAGLQATSRPLCMKKPSRDSPGVGKLPSRLRLVKLCSITAGTTLASPEAEY
jgi:hypothetical protein